MWHTHTMRQPNILMIMFLLRLTTLQSDCRCQDSSLKYALIFRVNKSQEQQAEKKSFVLEQLIFFRKFKPQKTKLKKLIQKKRQHNKKMLLNVDCLQNLNSEPTQHIQCENIIFDNSLMKFKVTTISRRFLKNLHVLLTT